MKKILINGYLGQMGRSVNDAIENSDTHESIFFVDLNSKITTKSSNNFENINKKIVEDTDCVVDFTNSKGFSESSIFAMKNNIPYVSGSTGSVSYTHLTLPTNREV